MKEINIEKWNRKEIYEHFSRVEFPFYSVTIPINVTRVKEVSKARNISFYHLMIWLLTKALNTVSAFKLRIRNGKVFELEEIRPNFIAMEKGEEIFKFIGVQWEENIEEFSKKATEATKKQKGLFGDQNSDDGVAYISCLPWADASSITTVWSFDTDDTIPRLTIGKYYKEGENLMLHLSISANHRAIDGIHIGKFIESLNNEITSLQ